MPYIINVKAWFQKPDRGLIHLWLSPVGVSDIWKRVQMLRTRGPPLTIRYANSKCPCFG